MADANNLYKKFRTVRDVISPGVYRLNKRFDEPTYISFRLIFGSGSDRVYNYAGNEAAFDTMPHPLFNPNTQAEINTGRTLGNSVIVNEENSYSALNYLINANEPTRAEMLKDFITKFNDLQNNYPYYFQEIDGVQDLLKIDPTKGQRITNDKKITITCLEGLDLRMSYLLNLYRKVVWDDVYQRWVLPDMMRYFTLRIYLAEFRTFHLPVTQSEPFPDAYNPAGVPLQSPVFLRMLDDILPVWEITCEMCEFDLTDISFTHLEGLNIAQAPNAGAVKFGVKIGNIKEEQIYPVFEHMFLTDRKLNGLNRSKEEISTRMDETSGIGKFNYQDALLVAQNREVGTINNQHESGMPYVERNNQNTTSDVKYTQSNAYNDKIPDSTDSTNSETWVGNALTFGKSYAKNFINKVVDKAKMTSIPGLGVSFTEVATAIQSKNIIAALGMIRKGINEVVQSYGNAPSSKLEGNMQTDNIMKQFLTTLTRSEATDDDTKLLAGAAGIALSDRGIWEQIKDYSLATDLIGQGERNTTKNLEGTNQYQQIIAQDSIYNPIRVQSGLPVIDPNAVSGNIPDQQLNRVTPSSQLTGNVQDNVDQPVPSERLASTTEGDKLLRDQPSELLGSQTQGGYLDRGIASSRLSSNAQSGNLQTSVPSSALDNVAAQPLKTVESNIKTKTISVNQVIEFDPTSILNKKLEGEPLKLPEPSKATNSKLEK